MTAHSTKPPKPIDRSRLRKLLGMLGSDHDGEVLSAARRVVALLGAANTTWEAIIPDLDDAGPAASSTDTGTEAEMIDALLASTKVSDILKIRLKAMRVSLRTNRLADRDRLYLRILHRKAVMDGVVVEA
ncbi:MAG TPA: hypothetical protein VNT30_12465 [Stellaceae bacterium]|nr:hypothetical protein [Stellaceae bacterium]